MLLVSSGKFFAQDQILDWFTFYGGPGLTTAVFDIEFSQNGEIYIAGKTDNEELVFGENVHQDFIAGFSDLYLAKFSSDGQLIWCTYFGGEGNEFLGSLSLNGNDHPVLTGSTNSEEGIVFGQAHQVEKNFGGDAFIAVFDASGSLTSSTYFGGNQNDGNIKSVCDSDGNVILGGRTYSTDLSTPGAYQANHQNSDSLDGFLAKFSPSLDLIWSTYFGASGDDFVESLDTDPDNNILVAFSSDSNSGLATSEAFQSQGLNKSPVITKFSGGGALLWSTYVSGEGDETHSKVSTNSEGAIFLSGMTSSLTGIATEEAFQENNVPGIKWPGGTSAYLMKFNASGERMWGTYFGGLASWIIDDMASTENGFVLIQDNNIAEDLIFGQDPFQSSIVGGRDVIVSKFSDDGDVVWSTAFGGNANEVSGAVSYSGSKIALVGNTASEEFYGDQDSWQPSYGGGPNDLFIAVLQENMLSVNGIYPESTSLSIHPNPSVDGWVQISWSLNNLEMADLIVFDIYGRIAAKINNYQRDTRIVPDLAPGIYFVAIEYLGQMHSKKFILTP
jgi:hypothetical protein